MERMLSRRGLLAGAGTMVSAALAGCSGLTPFVGKRMESTRTFGVEDVSALSATVDVGDVTVRSADREDVRVEVVKQSSSVSADLSKLEFRAERRDGRLRLRGEWTGNGGLSGRPSLDLDVAVPSSLAVDAVEAAVGDVLVEDVAGDLSVAGQTGDVTLRSVDGAVDVETQTGDVTVRDVSVLGGARAQTGDVDVDVPALDGDTTVSSQTGDVTAAVGDGVDAELRAETSTGDVTVEDVELSEERVEESSASGTLGDGGPTLRVETQTGDVVLTRLD